MDTHWDHEPGRGALTPTLSHLRFAAEGEGGKDGRFMESPLSKNDLLTAHEPGIPGIETPPSTAGGTPAATKLFPSSRFPIRHSPLAIREFMRRPEAIGRKSSLGRTQC